MRKVPHVGRRDVLRLLGAMSAASALPSCSKSSPAPASSGFFTADERAALATLADAILPPDQDPGGAALGAVQYIENLLTALDGDAPMLIAGGPYSGRHPYGDDHGAASSNSPPNDFENFLPLDRVALAEWRLVLYGSTGVDGGPNDAILGPVVGLRDQVKSGLLDAMSGASKPFSQMSADEAAQALRDLPSDFRELLVDLVSQAAFCAPEYGGNVDLAGWRIVHVEGDVQPLGYSIWDASANASRERADAPVSTADPGPDPDPLGADARSLMSAITQFTGGKSF